MPKKTETEEFEYVLKIPKERVAVLIGKKGEEKRQLEKIFRFLIIHPENQKHN